MVLKYIKNANNQVLNNYIIEEKKRG